MTRPRHKFGAVRTEVNGRTYASKFEASYAQQLHARKAAGEVIGWLEQVPLHLPGGVRYTIDFLVFLADGTVQPVETKGAETEAWKVRHAVASEVYPWLPIEVVYPAATVRAKVRKRQKQATARAARAAAKGAG